MTLGIEYSVLIAQNHDDLHVLLEEQTLKLPNREARVQLRRQ